MMSKILVCKFTDGVHWQCGLLDRLSVNQLVPDVFHAFNARSQRRSAFTERLFTNGWLWAAVGACIVLQLAAVYAPVLSTVLRTVALSAPDWGVVLLCSLAPVAVVEIVKVGQRAAYGQPQNAGL